VLVMAALLRHTTFVAATLGLPTKLGRGAILAFSSFLTQIPQEKEPKISVGIFSPT